MTVNKFNQWLIDKHGFQIDGWDHIGLPDDDSDTLGIKPLDQLSMMGYKWTYLWNHMNMDDIVEMQVSRNFDADDINKILDRYIDKIEDIDIGPLTTTIEAV